MSSEADLNEVISNLCAINAFQVVDDLKVQLSISATNTSFPWILISSMRSPLLIILCLLDFPKLVWKTNRY